MDNEVKEMVKNESEAEDLKEFLRKYSGDENGLDNFFLEVIRDEDSLKIGNLEEEELGLPDIPLRTILELKRDCESIPSLSGFANDFESQARDLIHSSLSKKGFLINARITQKKQLTDTTKKKRKVGLFGKKEVEE